MCRGKILLLDFTIDLEQRVVLGVGLDNVGDQRLHRLKQHFLLHFLPDVQVNLAHFIT
jgi:hypothetical protein